MQLESHFDDDLKFRQYEIDSLTGKIILKMVDIIQPTKDLTATLRGHKVSYFASIYKVYFIFLLFIFSTRLVLMISV